MDGGTTTPTTFAHTWATAVAARPQETYLIFEGPDGHVAEWTYGDFDSVVSRVAYCLDDVGVGPGHTVHLALTNSPTFVALWLATIRLGAWIVPSDPMGRTPELAEHIERTSPTIGFCADDRADPYRAAARPGMTVVEINETDVDLVGFGGIERADWPEPELTDRAAVMFTSGTTGRPKGVEVTQANYAFAGAVMARAAGLGPDDRQLVVLPLFHANAQYYSFASAISVGASVALIHTFSASRFCDQAVRHRATCASLFAAPIRMILARGAHTLPEGGAGLRHCWYAQNIAPDQYATVSEWFGCAPRQLYGMTETMPAVLTNPAHDARPDSMGQVTVGCRVEIHDRAGRAVPAGTEGEVVVGGEPGLALFAGYLDDPATTAASFQAGWFRTGDRGVCDSEGHFRFAGRGSDVLKVAGENVSTVEVEAVLSAHPGLLEAAVIGAPDLVRDEVPVAFAVAANPPRPPTITELTAWCEERLSKAKVPRSITLIDELPRTSVGKIRKFLLTEEATS